MAFVEHTPLRTLYHYCSVEGFKGIVSSGQLWLSDLRSSNDPREYNLGMQQITASIDALIRNEYDEERGLAAMKVAQKLKGYIENTITYSTCFSYEADSMPLWKEYAGNGAGLSLGFRPRSLTDMPLRIQKARYLSSEGEEELRNLCAEALKPIEIYGPTAPDYLGHMTEMVTSLASALFCAKHKSWVHEDEVRLTFSSVPKEHGMQIAELADGTPVYQIKPSHRMRGDQQIAYIPLAYGMFTAGQHNHSRAFERITVGPNCEMSKSEVEAFAADAGLSNFTVEVSSCEFR